MYLILFCITALRSVYRYKSLHSRKPPYSFGSCFGRRCPLISFQTHRSNSKHTILSAEPSNLLRRRPNASVPSRLLLRAKSSLSLPAPGPSQHRFLSSHLLDIFLSLLLHTLRLATDITPYSPECATRRTGLFFVVRYDARALRRPNAEEAEVHCC